MEAFLPAPNALSSLKSVTATLRGLVCRSSSPSFLLGLAVGGRVRLSPFAARPFAAGEPHVRRHSCFSPALYGTRAGHPSVQHFSLHHPEQGRRGLSFTVEGAAASRPSRHPISGMSSLTRHSASSVALPSRMGASTGGIAVGSPHNSNRLHSSVWEKSPPLRRGSPDSSKQRLQGLCSTTGTFLPPTERSNRGNTAVGNRTRVLQPLLPRSKEGRRLEAYSGSTAFEFFPLQGEVQDADDEDHHVSGPGGGLVCHHRPEGCVFSHPGRSKTQEVPSVCLWREGLPIQGPALRPGFGAENVYEMHGCCTGPFEAPGHSCTELSGRLAHSGSLQGASESSQGYRSRPHTFSWSQDERQEECALPILANHVSRGSFGFRSDAGPFGSCPDTRSYSMSGPLQARPSCLCRYLPQAVGPHGSGLPCVAPRVASHEAAPLVDEGAEITPHCTSYLPYQGVAQLLLIPFNVARPRFSPERGENGCDPPSPYDHDGRINDRLGRGLRRQTGERGVEGRVPLLAYKLPGTQGCLPGFEVFSPRSRGVSYHSQDGQYGGCVPHKPPRMFTVAHPGQACAPSSPLVPRQVPLFEGGSRSGNTEPGGRFSVESEAQAEGMNVEPSDGIPEAAATTLRVYVAAIAARRELDEIPLGRHRMVSAFMRGVRRLRPVRPTAVPSWDLSVVLEGLVTAPFGPLY